MLAETSGEAPGKTPVRPSLSAQGAAAGIRRHQELMQRVLREPQLVRVQREGGFVLARLRREAARLCSSEHIRYCGAVLLLRGC